MPFEITCGQCGGRLLIEQSGVIVACPMCDAHLSIPEAEADPAPTIMAAATDLAPTIMAVSGVVDAPPPTFEPAPPEFLTGHSPAAEAPTILAAPVADEAVDLAFGSVQEGTPSSQPTEWISHSSPRLDEFILPTEEPAAPEELFQPPDELPDFTSAAPSDPYEPTVQISGAQFDDQATQLPTQFDAAPASPPIEIAAPTVVLPPARETEAATEQFAAPIAPAAAAPATRPAPPAAPAPVEMVPRQWFLIAAGYASAVTLALLLVLFGFGRGREHALESLPDLAPPVDKSGNIGMKKVPQELDVAPGHVLSLGDSQRFGNVRVTPVKIVRSPLQFEHAFNPKLIDPKKKLVTRAPSEPVLKLHLKFENVSPDQTFAPLDGTLAFKRIFESRTGKVFALNFLGPEADRKSGAELHYLYDLPEFSEFTLAGQHLGRTLQPGETCETYLPSEEGLSQVDGDWVWRVLIRKGYHPESKRGVTTLFDVRFDANDVVNET